MKRWYRSFSVPLFAVVLLAAFCAAAAAYEPVVPTCYEGSVRDSDGDPLESGAVRVYIAGTLFGEAEISDGRYSVIFEGERGLHDQPVEFRVVAAGTEYPAESVPAEVRYREGAYEEVDLTADIPAGTTGGSGGSSGGSGGEPGQQQPAPPEASPAPGSYTGCITVTLSAAEGTTVYYTTDGSDPRESATRREYTAPISVENDLTISAVACQNGVFSAVVTFSYQISAVEPPPDGGAAELTDITGHWAADTIRALVYRGILSGYPDGTFRPEQRINRAECAAVMVRALGLGTGDPAVLAGFSDEAAIPGWARGVVAAASEAGILSGYPEPDGGRTFRPERPLTRVELAAILSRVLAQKKGATNAPPANFADQAQIPSWAREAVNSAAQAGLVKGYTDGSFRPQREVTRAEAAAMIARLLEKLEAG